MSMFSEADSGKPVPFDLRGVVLAGYTGRDQESVKRHIEELAEHVLYLPRTEPELQPVLAVLPLQQLAYAIATRRGLDVDKPRNLAKTVTVE